MTSPAALPPRPLMTSSLRSASSSSHAFSGDLKLPASLPTALEEEPGGWRTALRLAPAPAAEPDADAKICRSGVLAASPVALPPPAAAPAAAGPGAALPNDVAMGLLVGVRGARDRPGLGAGCRVTTPPPPSPLLLLPPLLTATEGLAPGGDIIPPAAGLCGLVRADSDVCTTWGSGLLPLLPLTSGVGRGGVATATTPSEPWEPDLNAAMKEDDVEEGAEASTAASESALVCCCSFWS